MKSSDVIMLKLIKMYVLTHPQCTAKQISDFFICHKFGVRKEYTAQAITKLIDVTMNSKSTQRPSWFKIEYIYDNGRKKYIAKE